MKNQQKFIDELKNSKDPEASAKGMGYFITWAGGRASVAYKQKEDAIVFVAQDDMEVVKVEYRKAEKGERVRNKFTAVSSKTYKTMKKAWDQGNYNQDYHPGSNTAGPVPYSIPKSPGSIPRNEQRTTDDYHAPSQLDRDPIPGGTQPEQGTGGQSHSGDPGKIDNIYPEPSNWLRPLKGIPVTEEHLVHDFNVGFDTEYTQRQRGLDMRRRKKFTLDMKNAQDVPKWTNPEFLGSALYDRIKGALQKYNKQIQENPALEESLVNEVIPEVITRDQDIFISAGITLPIILEAIKETARLLMAQDKIILNTLLSEQKAVELYPDPRQPSSEMAQMTAEEARLLEELSADQIWDIARNVGTANTPEGQIARSLIQKGIVASKLNLKKKAQDILDEAGQAAVNQIIAQWQQTAEVAGVDTVLDIFNDNERAYNIVMSDLKGKYPGIDMHRVAVEVVLMLPQVLQTKSSKLNLKKKAKVNPKYDHGTVQTSDISETVIDAIKDIQKNIDKDKLYDGEDEPGWVENGIQKLFHITVLFGVNDNIEDEVKKVFDKYRPVHIETTNIKYFSSDPNYDVAVVRCKSEELTKIHDELKNSLENKETYPNYKPHITIAYLKKGERLDDVEQISNISWEVDSLDISTSDGNLEKISALNWDKLHAGPLKKEEIQPDHPFINDKKWQEFRKSLKGLSNVEKYKQLSKWLSSHNNSHRSKVQVTNYINALKRGGQVSAALAVPIRESLDYLHSWNKKKKENKEDNKKNSSILDEPRASLDSAIWNIGRDNLPMLKPDVKIHIVTNFFDYISKFGGYIKPEQWVKNMFYTGSTATYSYNDMSDIDIHIIVDWTDLAALNPDKAKENLKEMWQELHDVFWWTLNKIKLPGTKHPLTYYVMPPGEEKQLVGRKEELYDIGHEVWLIPPGKAVDLTEEVINPALEEASEFMSRINQHMADARKGVIDYALLLEVITPENAASRYIQIAEKLREIDNDLKELKNEYALLKQKRMDAFEKGDSLVGGNSNYSLGNIIFKLVERYKYLDVLRKIKRITDDMDLKPDQVQEIANVLGLNLEEE